MKFSEKWLRNILNFKNSRDDLISQLPKIDSQILIADGSSSDKTLEFLERFSFCKIISFSDNSPEEALNKLIKVEPKNLKIILGSDDWVSEEYLSSFVTEADKLVKQGINKFVLIPKFNIVSSYIPDDTSA